MSGWRLALDADMELRQGERQGSMSVRTIVAEIQLERSRTQRDKHRWRRRVSEANCACGIETGEAGREVRGEQ